MTDTTIDLMNNHSLKQLENEFNKKIEQWNYLPDEWEWLTKATQLATAICKIDYRYYNDGDRYDRTSEIWTYANRIHNHCFKLKRFSNYEDNLKYMLIMWISIIDSLSDVRAEWSVYTEEWTWKSHKYRF